MTKALRSKNLTSREVARLLGVSEASVKRWADSGLLPMEKTAGGHRRFRPEDVARIRREGLADETSRPRKERSAARFLAQPVNESGIATGDEGELVEEIFRALLDGRDEELSALLVNLHLHGRTVARIADAFLCPAMHSVGERWHSGQLSVAQEHIATRTAISALKGLEAVTSVDEEEKMFALCCSVEEDFHGLPLRLATLTLAASGFEVFELGMSTPFSALTETVERFRPSLVCVSSTMLVNLDRAVREYSEFEKTARRRHARIILGGAGFADAGLRERFPADLHAESFLQLEEFASSLYTGES